MNHKKTNDASNANNARTENAEKNNSSVWDGDDFFIHSYSRAQAIEDGVLIDAGKLAAEAGFRYPVALTHAAWETCVSVPASTTDQDETGRLWDVLNCLRSAARRTPGSTVEFQVLVKQAAKQLSLVQLKSICGPGDNHEPVVTIMLPNED